MRAFAPRRTGVGTGNPAERFLKEIKPQLMRAMLRRTHVHPYLAFQVLRALRRRARELDLVLRGSKREALSHAAALHERVVADLLRRNEESYFV